MRLPYTNVRVSVCKIVIAFPILKTSARSVQTSAVVCADYTCSLYRLQLKSPESTTYLQIYVRALTETSTRTYRSKYVVLTQKKANKETARRSPKGQVLLVLLWSFAECGNRKALRLKAQGVY